MSRKILQRAAIALLAASFAAGEARVFAVTSLDSNEASHRNYGKAFPGTIGDPELTANSEPVLGGSTSITLGNSRRAPTSGVLFVGFEEVELPGSWGGDLLVRPAVTIPVSMGVFGLKLSGSIADDPDLCGVSLYLQLLEVDPGAAGGISSSQGLELVLGS